jgi:hypothetical protein
MHSVNQVFRYELIHQKKKFRGHLFDDVIKCVKILENFLFKLKFQNGVERILESFSERIDRF